MVRTLAVGFAFAAFAFIGVPSQAVADPPAQFAIGKCVDPGQPVMQRPARFAYNCDETGVMEDMSWTSWGANGAAGTGTDSSVEGQPNCAEGTRRPNPIVVHAGNA